MVMSRILLLVLALFLIFMMVKIRLCRRKTLTLLRTVLKNRVVIIISLTFKILALKLVSGPRRKVTHIRFPSVKSPRLITNFKPTRRWGKRRKRRCRRVGTTLNRGRRCFSGPRFRWRKWVRPPLLVSGHRRWFVIKRRIGDRAATETRGRWRTRWCGSLST